MHIIAYFYTPEQREIPNCTKGNILVQIELSAPSLVSTPSPVNATPLSYHKKITATGAKSNLTIVS